MLHVFSDEQAASETQSPVPAPPLPSSKSQRLSGQSTQPPLLRFSRNCHPPRSLPTTWSSTIHSHVLQSTLFYTALLSYLGSKLTDQTGGLSECFASAPRNRCFLSQDRKFILRKPQNTFWDLQQDAILPQNVLKDIEREEWEKSENNKTDKRSTTLLL